MLVGDRLPAPRSTAQVVGVFHRKGDLIMLESLHNLIETVDWEPAKFPRTLLYNEGWMLRLILNWYSQNSLPGHPLEFQPNATWYSEALLPSPFRARRRGDRQAETRTHADSIVGHFVIASGREVGPKLLPDATQFIVAEAKMFSPLSGGTRNAPTFDQAARTVACISEILRRAKRRPSHMTSLAFFVVAPAVQIDSGVFAKKLEKASIKSAVEARAKAFAPDLDGWLGEWFCPTLESVRVEALAWESLIDAVTAKDPTAFQDLQAFYQRCMMYNARQTGALTPQRTELMRDR